MFDKILPSGFLLDLLYMFLSVVFFGFIIWLHFELELSCTSLVPEIYQRAMAEVYAKLIKKRVISWFWFREEQIYFRIFVFPKPKN